MSNHLELTQLPIEILECIFKYYLYCNNTDIESLESPHSISGRTVFWQSWTLARVCTLFKTILFQPRNVKYYKTLQAGHWGVELIWVPRDAHQSQWSQFEPILFKWLSCDLSHLCETSIQRVDVSYSDLVSSPMMYLLLHSCPRLTWLSIQHARRIDLFEITEYFDQIELNLEIFQFGYCGLDVTEKYDDFWSHSQELLKCIESIRQGCGKRTRLIPDICSDCYTCIAVEFLELNTVYCSICLTRVHPTCADCFALIYTKCQTGGYKKRACDGHGHWNIAHIECTSAIPWKCDECMSSRVVQDIQHIF